MKKATFNFSGYSFEKFEIDNSKSPKGETSISLIPSGVLSKKDNIYLLNINFSAFEKNNNENPFISCVLNAKFNFSEDIKDIESIPKHFYSNSIAIVFPYLRAFISSLTVQANIKPIILPTMNLGSLGEPLKENTEIV